MFKKLRIKKPLGTELEPQEVILDRLVQAKKEKIGQDQTQKLERPIRKKGIKFWAFFSLVVWMIFLGKTGYLQLAQGKFYRQLSARNQFLIRSIEAERGVIYDRSLHQLVQNVASFDLILDKDKFSQDSQAELCLTQIANLLHQDKNKLRQIIQKSSENQILLAQNLDKNSLLTTVNSLNQWEEISVHKELIREYPSAEVLAHVLGFVSHIDKRGVAGLEKSYDSILQPTPGKLQITRDSQGKQIKTNIIQNPSPGQSLVLNIDLALQQKIYDVLKKRMEAVHSSQADAVALDPNNGHVLALVSLPSYNNNIFSQPLSPEKFQSLKAQKDFSLFNAAISGIGFPTGSIIKPLIGLAALEENIITPDTILPCPEKICVPNQYTKQETCYHDWKYHGPSDLRRAIAESINTFFYVVGGGTKDFPGLGAEKIKEWLQRFRWGQLTGIDLPQEGKGILPNINQNWHLGDTYHLSIGQGSFAATPLQVAVAYSALANGGTLYQPQVVKAIIQKKGSTIETIKEIEPVVLGSSLGQLKNIEVIREGMRQAVTSIHGSSHALNDLPEPVASKTGTAQTGTAKQYHNWIAVFGPYQKPNIVLVLMLKDVPKNMVALRPAAKEILNWYFSQQNDKLK